MTDVCKRFGLNRMLWDLNVNVAAYAHPGWLTRLENQGDGGRIQPASRWSKRLIAQHRLDFVPAEQLSDTLGRTALLDALDLYRLARWGATLTAREDIRLCVFGSEIRHCIRVLDRRMFDQGILLGRAIDLELFDQLGRQCKANRLPMRLLEIQRRLIRAMCDYQHPAAAQRMRLRFRPGYFDRIAPLDGEYLLLQALLSMHEHAGLSERGTCILAC